MRVSEGRTIPVRDLARESATAGPGPVKTYKLSEDELEDLRARTGYTPPTNKDGVKEKPPVAVAPKITPEEQSRRAQMRKREPSKVPEKEVVLERIARGESIASIERSSGTAPGTLSYWIKKWGLTGITPKKAKVLLGEAPAVDPAPTKAELPTAAPVDSAKVLAEHRAATADLNQANAKVERLTAELDLARAKHEEFAKIIEDLRIDLQQHRQANAELLEERKQLLQWVDPAIHPAHYTAGTVECIAAIESATVGLVSGQAYITGAVIESLWHWNRKGGIESLRKARLYIDRLIEETGA